jgi:hypothetical protein
MARQRSLDFGGEQLAAIWRQVPERCRKQAVALWGQLIAAAAQRRSKGKGVTR